jgi:serine/threonine protein kinase
MNGQADPLHPGDQMTESNWDRLQEIYHAAMELPPSEREAYLAEACKGNPDLLRDLSAIVHAEREGKSALDDEPVAVLGSGDDLLGKTIGDRYLIMEELPHKGMSRVYLGLDTKLPPQQVVVKVLSHGMVEEPYVQRKFEQEVAVLIHIDQHPGIVKVRDHGKIDNRPYIVTQHVKGEPLRSSIPNKGLDLNRAGSILKQIGDALEHVHRRGVFHRDLKPENVMLDHDSDSIVLIDFGIAKVKNSNSAPTTMDDPNIGTLPYMSPEQLRREEITAASDIFSMAVIAYELVTGRPPFDGKTQFEVMKQQRQKLRVKPRTLRPDLPAEAQKLIRRGLSFDPSKRPQSAKEFGDSLALALASPIKETKKWKGVAVTVVIVALLVCGGAIGAYKYLRPPATYVDEARPAHSFTYWLTLQRMRDGKEYQQPFNSNGEETFEAGDKFRLNVKSSEAGYLYIFSERTPKQGSTSFTMLYPNQQINNGAASLGPNQTISSEWITFQGPAGDENFWIVWSISPVSQLENAKSDAFNHPVGGLSEQNLVAVREFLRARQLEIAVKVFHYKANQTAVVRGRSDLLLTYAQFKHR